MNNYLEIESIGQIAIAVSDKTKAVEFYRDKLGLILLFEAGSNLAFFDCGGTRLMITTLQGEERDHRTSVIYYKVKDISAAATIIKEKGIEFVREPQMAAKMEDHELWIGFIRDPDENLIGIMSEVPFVNER